MGTSQMDAHLLNPDLNHSFILETAEKNPSTHENLSPFWILPNCSPRLLSFYCRTSFGVFSISAHVKRKKKFRVTLFFVYVETEKISDSGSIPKKKLLFICKRKSRETEKGFFFSFFRIWINSLCLIINMKSNPIEKRV